MTLKNKKIEKYEKRFGQVAIEKGYIKTEDLIKAMADQVYEEQNDQERRQVGFILLQNGKMKASQLEEIVKTVMEYKEKK